MDTPAPGHLCCDEVEWLDSRQSVLGQGTRIRRALPHRERRLIGAWCFLDHAGPVQFAEEQGLHVGPHPHIGLQTFTWLIEGELRHRDSLGTDQRIRSGQVNLMTAGRGIIHSEDSATAGDRLHAAQLWIALPEAERHRPPAFAHYPQLPVLTQEGVQLTVLVGTYQRHTSPVEVYSPLIALDVQLQAGTTLPLVLQAGFEHGLLVLEGKLLLEHQDRLSPATLLYLPPGLRQLSIKALAPTRVLLIGGAPLNETPLLWWNFVARTEAELRQAVDDWNTHPERFGPMPEGSGAAPLQAPALGEVRLQSPAD